MQNIRQRPPSHPAKPSNTAGPNMVHVHNTRGITTFGYPPRILRLQEQTLYLETCYAIS